MAIAENDLLFADLSRWADPDLPDSGEASVDELRFRYGRDA